MNRAVIGAIGLSSCCCCTCSPTVVLHVLWQNAQGVGLCRYCNVRTYSTQQQQQRCDQLKNNPGKKMSDVLMNDHEALAAAAGSLNSCVSITLTTVQSQHLVEAAYILQAV